MRIFRPHCTNALFDVCDCSGVSEQKILDAGTKAARPPVRARALIKLDHAAHVWEKIDYSTQRIEREQVIRCVLCDELNIIVLSTVLWNTNVEGKLWSSARTLQVARARSTVHSRATSPCTKLERLVGAYPKQFDH